jgi:hypothetical protein
LPVPPHYRTVMPHDNVLEILLSAEAVKLNLPVSTVSSSTTTNLSRRMIREVKSIVERTARDLEVE